jgi:hypothetical protein
VSDKCLKTLKQPQSGDGGEHFASTWNPNTGEWGQTPILTKPKGTLKQQIGEVIIYAENSMDGYQGTCWEIVRRLKELVK